MANTSTSTRTRSQSKAPKKSEAAGNTGDGPISGAAKVAREKVDTAVETTRDAGQEALKQVQETGRQLYDDGTDVMRSAQSDFDQAVRRNPTVAMLGALGVGVLIGLAVKARS